jgi:hypothetical protein
MSVGKGGDEADGPTAAFRRLLAQVAGDDRARVDALVALSQRTVFAATWPTDPESGIRTLTSSGGETAMPVFTGVDALKAAAVRFGWNNADGTLTSRELGAREALRRAVARGVQLVVVDIGTPHAVEFTRSEIEPLIAVSGRSDATGPFAVSTRLSSALMQAVRATSRPPPFSLDAAASGPRPRSDQPAARLSAAPAPVEVPVPAPSPLGSAPSEHRYVSVVPRSGSSSGNLAAQRRPSEFPPSRARSVTPDASRLTGPLADPTGMTFRAPDTSPSADALDQIADAIRRFPEVEWASAVTAIKDGVPHPVIVLRVDTAHRKRLADLNRSVRLASEDAGATMGVVVVDDPTQIKSARSVGVVFFPWKKARTN